MYNSTFVLMHLLFLVASLVISRKKNLFVHLCSQLPRKQKQAEGDKKVTAPSTVCDEAPNSGFIDIPLSLPVLPPEGQKEEPQDSVQPCDATAQLSQLPLEKQQTSSPQALCTSGLTETLETSLNLPTVTTDVTVHPKESNAEEEEDGGVKVHGSEIVVVPQTTKLEKDMQSWSQPFVTQLEVPSVPTLYPSLHTLEEDSVLQFCGETMPNCAKEPAVLALPEQESLESEAELSTSKLYPALPKTAPEMQVISCSMT